LAPDTPVVRARAGGRGGLAADRDHPRGLLHRMRPRVDDIAELRDALDRLFAALDDLVVRGLRAAGAKELARLTALRDEFRAAGAEHLAGPPAAVADAL